MYHIKPDARSQRSAQLICQTFLDCLQEEEYSKITVTKIQQKTYISRATFYRLFDGLPDVISYRCDQIFQEIHSGCQESSLSPNEVHLQILNRWMQEDILLKAMLDNSLFELYCASAFRVLGGGQELHYPMERIPEAQVSYIRAISVELVSCVLRVWMENGKQETAEELLALIKNTCGYILHHLDGDTDL